MKSFFLLSPLLCFLILGFSCVAMAVPLQNGDFSNEFAGWRTEGDVAAVNGEAALGDNAAFYSLLQQGVALAIGDYTFAFDFKNQLSGTVPNDPPFAFLDTFFATLYFTDDLNGFHLAPGGFDAAAPLFSLDANGVFDSFGGIGPSGKGSDWSRFSLNFHNSHAYVVPVFELLDMNFLDSDSRVLLDNVGITKTPEPTVIPEPSTVVLTGCGILTLLIARARRRSRGLRIDEEEARHGK